MSSNYGYLYNIAGWGDPYFAVNSSGNVAVKINGVETNSEQEIDLLAAVNAATAKSLQFPFILRFPDVLKHRLDSLHAEFAKVIESTKYTSHYQGVFPVKVNQNKDVVDDVVSFGKGYNFGLEAGSKPELLLAMHSLLKGGQNAYLVCNGYKDMDYISLALMARSTINLNTIIVLELEEEVDTVVAASQALGVRPVLGIRARLLTTIPGHFGSTSGKHGKFGLLEAQIYAVAEKLKQLGMLDCLQLLHFHVGSQIPTTSIIYNAVREATGYYCNLVHMEAPMGTLDIGGGLGIDYDGTRSGSSDMSVAYGLEEYASAVVQAAKLVCNQNGVAHPVLCSESGRGLVSHYSVLIYDALSAVVEPSDSVTPDELISGLDDLVGKPITLHDNIKTAVQSKDSNNNTSLAHADQLNKHGVEIFKLSRRLAKLLEAAGGTTYDYHVNLSVFSLTPDFWGIKQLFPILPIHRLNEQPAQKGRLIDLTCDSDGKIDKFIGGAQTLPLHALDKSGGGYYIGTFLAGAYQEALGSRHNLFGGPTLVRVESTTAGSSGEDNFKVALVAKGPSAADQLKVMHHDPDKMIDEIAKTQEAKELVKRVFNTMPYLFGKA